MKLRDELQHVAQSIPNMTHPDVPVGGEDSSAIRNEVVSLVITPSTVALTMAFCCERSF